MRAGSKPLKVALGWLLFFIFLGESAHAEHGDWLLGTEGLLSALQPPEGILYQKFWSYYHASDDFLQITPRLCSPPGNCFGFDANAPGSLDLFVDQNIFWFVTPYRLLGGNYGFLIDVPFAIADASGAASLEPVGSGGSLGNVALPSLGASNGATKGSIGDIYFEPVNLGWHFRQLDAVVSGGFFAPTGPYNSKARLNIGSGHWSGALGLGGIVYADKARTWGFSIFSHYILYASQMGRNYTYADQIPFEFSASKTFTLGNSVLQEATIGAVG